MVAWHQQRICTARPRWTVIAATVLDMTDLLIRDAALYLGSTASGRPRFSRGDLAVTNGRITALGPSGTLDEASVADTINAGGKTVLPGFQDAHVHPTSAGLALLGIDLAGVHDLDEYRRLISEGGAQDPSPVLTGSGWYADAFPGDAPTAHLLDEVISDRPVILTGHDGHTSWVNSAALRAAGIDRNTPDPADGAIARDDDGHPTGVLFDGAMRLIAHLTPEVDEDRIVAALRAAQQRLHSVGITAWQDAMVGDSELGPDPQSAYTRLVTAGELTGHVVQGLWWDRERGLEQIDDLVARRQNVRDVPGIRADVIKIMQDGMVENRTAAMLSPYAGPGPQNDCGPSFIDPQLLSQAALELERQGFDLHFHAVGDRAVRECLDAVAGARGINGPTGLRHQIAHLDVVDPADLPRFAELGVTANVQMLWARRDQEIVQRKLGLLGPGREPHHFPFGALHAAGAQLAAGSDWPVSAPDPLLAIHTATTRTAPAEDVHAIGDGVLTNPLEPAQAIPLGTALDAFLTGAAYANRLETRTGALRVGMDADLAILDTDLAEAAGPGGSGIGSVNVAATFVAGKPVYVKK